MGIFDKNYNVILILHQPNQFLLIGDSINDFEAVTQNQIGFCGNNNPSLKKLGEAYLKSLEGVEV